MAFCNSHNVRQKPWNTLNILAPYSSPSLFQCCCSQSNSKMSSQHCAGEGGVSRIFGEDCNLRQKPWNTLNILAPYSSPSLFQFCCSQSNSKMSSQHCAGEGGVSRIFGEDCSCLNLLQKGDLYLPSSSSVLHISTHLLNLCYHLIGFCVHILINWVSTVEHTKGTKNCTLHLPVLELAPSRSVVLSSSLHYTTTTNMLNPTKIFLFFTFLWLVNLISMYKNQN